MIDPVASAAELPAGQTRKETEGVFVIRDGRAEFVPIKMGIAGEQYFEVLSGLKPGDEVITGPFASVRSIVRRRRRESRDDAGPRAQVAAGRASPGI